MALLTNRLLLRHRDGFSLVEDSGSVSTFKAREAFLSLGQLGKEQAEAQATAMLVQLADRQTAYQAAVHPRGADTPLIDFKTGDTVNVPAPGGGTADVRVMAVTVTEDANGRLHYVPELGVVKLDPVQRHERTVKAMSAGTISGAIGSASPAPPPAPVGRSRGLGAGLDDVAWGAKAATNGAPALTDATDTVLDLESGQPGYWNEGGYYDGGAPSRLTAPVGHAGVHVVDASLGFDGNDDTGTREAWFRVNGVEVRRFRLPSIPTGGTIIALTDIVYLAEGDYVEVAARSDSGDAGVNVGCEVEIVRLGSATPFTGGF